MSRTSHNAGIALYSRGVELYQNERFGEAADHFQKAVAEDPELYRGHAFLGLCLAKLGRVDEAIESNLRCLKIEPEYDKAHNNLGECWRRKLMMETAADHFTEAVRLKPDVLDYHANLAMTQLDMKRPDKAVPPLRRALALEAGNYEFASKLADHCNVFQCREVAEACRFLEHEPEP